MLHFIGIGLRGIKGMARESFDVVASCSHVFIEQYTAVLPDGVDEIRQVLGCEFVIATRDMVEQDADRILDPAQQGDVAFLVCGDIFAATTHTDLWLRARSKRIECRFYPHGSVLTAVGVCGLELYKYGKTTSMVFFEDRWKPHTAYDVIALNKSVGLHTLVLADIKMAEPSLANLAKGVSINEPPRFMKVGQIIQQLLDIERERSQGIFSADTLCVGCARLGCDTQQVVSGSAKQLVDVDFGDPMHCLVVPGQLHFVEQQALEEWRVS